MKKLLSLLLCAVLVFSLGVLPAAAAEEAAELPAESAAPEDAAEVFEDISPVEDAAEADAVGEAEPSHVDASAVEVPDVVEPALSEDTSVEYASDEPVTVPEESPAEDGADTIATSGTIAGTSLTWQIESGVLTVSGKGAIPDYADSDVAQTTSPWYPAHDLITKIVVEDGVTAIGSYAFARLYKAAELSLPESVKTLGSHAFYFDSALTSVVVPSGVTVLPPYVFSCCGELKQITLPAGLKRLEAYALDETRLASLTLPDGLEYLGPNSLFARYGTFTELTLPGSLGDLAGEEGAVEPPLGAYSDLQTVTLQEGITAVPQGFFTYSYNLETMELPSTIRMLGHDFINHSLFTSEDGSERKAKLKTIRVAARDSYEFAGWQDENGDIFSNEDLCAGKEYDGDLTAVWLRIWKEGVFTDVPSDAWYHDAVEFCYRTELMNGMSATKFQPKGVGTRAQAVTILYRLAGSPAVSSASTLSDVKKNSWYSDAVAWAETYGITTGYEDGTFRPNRAVSRQEFVTLLYRMAQYLSLASKTDRWEDEYTADFPDADKIGSWARDAENWSVAVGLQQGSAEKDGKLWLRPASTVTRAELATYLTNYSVGIDDIALLGLVHSMLGDPVRDFTELFGNPDKTTYYADPEDRSAQYGTWTYDGFLLYTYRPASGKETVYGAEITE